ncbi:DUF3179 domain-containing (seleno)protein [Candidatus Palauibacter sp.]|uniref:DUF3179 domain-containing (seleno)protein n=1 Tax=Candidatus Palauibacter sp. TaxID=3101350 RepID=UPI003C6FDE12
MRTGKIDTGTRPGRRAAPVIVVLFAAAFPACSGDNMGPDLSLATCSLPLESLTDGGRDRSSIPALDNPEVARRLIAPEVGYVQRSDQVIALHFNDQPLAIPLKLLWYHEVLNFSVLDERLVPDERLTVTYSPLTGSVGVFNPEPSGASDFRVSSYVLDNNLVMEDGSGTFYPQLAPSATCGPRDGTRLTRVPYELMTYGAWLLIYLDTWIVSRDTGHDFLYTLYPYGNYRTPSNTWLFYPTAAPIDRRRLPKETVIGVPAGSGGIAFPLADLRAAAVNDQPGSAGTSVWAASGMAGGEPVVAFWNTQAQSARVYRARAGGRTLTFEVMEGRRQDVETGSIWNFNGRAVTGPLEGERLEPHPESYHAFWFAWAAFQPDIDVWRAAPSFDAAAGAVVVSPPRSLDPDLVRQPR